jgi:glycine cleavage system transcriptional repressor
MVGEDRPGIVARLTEVLVKHDANLEESRMAILGGEFAAIVLISAPESKFENLKKDLAALHSEGILVTHKGTQPQGSERFAGYSWYRLSLAGADHEGIVFKVAQMLRERSINIQSMETGVVPAPETAKPLFKMEATIAVPSSIRKAELEKELTRISEEELVDIQVKEVDSTKATVSAVKV